MMRTILILGRVSNLPTVWTNVLAAWFVAGGVWDWRILWVALGGSLLYVGGMTMNDAFDADWDKKFGKDRPIPAGKISRRSANFIGWIEMLGGVVVFVWAARIGHGAPWLLGLVAAIVAYNILHKRFSGAMWIMGLCRALLFITAASCATGLATPDRPFVWFWAVALFTYVVGLTYAAQGENTGVGGAANGMVRLLSSILLFWFPVMLGVLMLKGGDPETLMLRIGVVILFAAWILISYMKLPQVGAFVSMLLAGMVLVDAMAVSSVPIHGLNVAAICAAALPLNRLLQRFIPAT